MARHSRYGYVDRCNPQAAGVCDRGGETRPLHELKWEVHWAGDRLVRNGLRVCAQHMDRPNPRERLVRIRPETTVRDPRPPEPLPPTDAYPMLDINFYLDESDLS